LSDFPQEEYEDRCKKARNLMDDHGLDMLLLTQEENLTYFSGFRPILTGESKDRAHLYHILILPREGSPVLVLPLVMRGNAQIMSWVDDLRFFLADWTFAPFLSVNPSDPIDLVEKAITELKLENKTIGLELGGNTRIDMSQRDFQTIRQSLIKAQFVDASDLLWQMRTLKSAQEIQHIRKACGISCKAFQTTLETMKRGMTDKEITRTFYKATLDQGSEDMPSKMILVVRAGKERYGLAFTRPSGYKIKEGDIVLMDGGANWKGYWCDMTRIACVGAPSSRQKKLFDCALKSQESALDKVRAGIPIKNVAASAVDTARKLGCERNLPYTSHGHGIGLSVHEPPYIGVKSEGELRAGMVVTIEPTFYDETALNYITKGIGEHGAEGVFYVEDNVVVTTNGSENLTPLSKDLWIVK